jgi:outer membrane phospholipase A
MHFEVAPTLGATLVTATASFPVTLTTMSEEPMDVEPRGFAARAYAMTIPDAAPEGQATLRVDAGAREVAATMLVVSDAGAGSPELPNATRDSLTTAPAVATFPRTLPGRLAIHQPNYFVYGAGNEPAAKFQFSLKYRLLTFGGPERPSLQLAYTQRSLWDLRESSQPFYDTSYMPELFVESLRPPSSGRRRPLSFLGWAAGYRHESNGKGGEDSRGCDVLYARAGLAGGATAAWYFAIVPEIWQYLATTDQLPDLEEYRGYGKLQLIVGHGSGPGLAWSASPADGFRRVTHQIDLTLPIGVRKLDFGTYFVVHYFDGYAESLLDYTHASRSVRAGFALVR